MNELLRGHVVIWPDCFFYALLAYLKGTLALVISLILDFEGLTNDVQIVGDAPVFDELGSFFGCIVCRVRLRILCLSLALESIIQTCQKLICTRLFQASIAKIRQISFHLDPRSDE